MKQWVIFWFAFSVCGIVFADHSHDEIKHLRDEDVIVPLESIIKEALILKPGRVIEVELKRERGRYIYEIEVLDKNRQVWEFYFDAQNGELLKQEVDD